MAVVLNIKKDLLKKSKAVEKLPQISSNSLLLDSNYIFEANESVMRNTNPLTPKASNQPAIDKAFSFIKIFF